MAGVYKFKTSRLARWALWLARLTIPVAILSFLLMRFGGVHPSLAIYCFGASLLLALLAILVSLAAFPAIWFEGHIGGNRILGTLLRSFVVILPALALAYLYFTRPAFSDLSTNPVDPPEFEAAWQMREDADNSLDVVSLAEREKQALAYPELASISIDHPIEVVYLLVADELAKQKWQLISATDHAQAQDGARFEAYYRSMITGLRYVVAIRLRPDGDERTVLDMRSASLWGPHDFGRNANSITGFISSVEQRVEQGIAAFELQLEEIERQRRLQQGPMPRPKPKELIKATT
ncbi:DUF1499 domain-containing protein [uncultured Cohaesibacter sp.]|uniref:DUF1499 domain-containing protein n=1 Tax=uncultured Cohaesibacter sp. TaxID=1002546 RepID=UPI0029C717B0|nr:DUF1499 domain-containing protein [uncultured Cohaesibacter sp.]